MSTLAAYLAVFVAAATPWLEVLLVVPAGILAGLPPVPTAIIGAAGNTATLVPLVLVGDRVRSWWRRRRAAATDDDDEAAPRGTRARRLFERYGLPGLALLGPLVTGIHVAAVAALAAGADRRRTAWWLTAGVVAWAGVAAAATALGVGVLFGRGAAPSFLPEAR